MDRDHWKKMLPFIEAYIEGKTIQAFDPVNNKWYDLIHPNFGVYLSYRIKPITKPSINWDCVREDYKWLAIDKSGDAYFYTHKPIPRETQWAKSNEFEVFSSLCRAESQKSLNKGSCDWKDSLVERPS